jgi:thioredoxin 1
MSTIALTADTFEALLAKEGIVFIDFWAAWCGPCRYFAPVFEAAAKKHPDIHWAKVDTEAEPALAGALEIRSIPTLMIFRDGILLFSQPGALAAAARRAGHECGRSTWTDPQGSSGQATQASGLRAGLRSAELAVLVAATVEQARRLVLGVIGLLARDAAAHPGTAFGAPRGSGAAVLALGAALTRLHALARRLHGVPMLASI